MRLFRSAEADIQMAAAQALVRFAEKSGRPAVVVRCLLQIVATQRAKVSAHVVTSLRKVVVTLDLRDADSERCIATLTGLLAHPKPAMQQCAAQTIASALLASSRECLTAVVQESALFDAESMHTALIILNDMLRTPTRAVLDIILPFALEMLPTFQASQNQDVQKWYPVMLATLIIADPALTGELLPRLGTMARFGSIQAQVVACKEFSRLAKLPPQVWDAEQGAVLGHLMAAYLRGPPAARSAVAESVFDLFKLDELDEMQRAALGYRTGEGAAAVIALSEMFTEVESDRANRRITR
jgi:hypothetical protein